MNPVRKKLQTLSEEERANLYRSVFSSVDGQLVLEDLKERSYFYTTTFKNGFTEFNEGVRASVLHIETQLNSEPEADENLGD